MKSKNINNCHHLVLLLHSKFNNFKNNQIKLIFNQWNKKQRKKNLRSFHNQNKLILLNLFFPLFQTLIIIKVIKNKVSFSFYF